ncbi:MAG: 50S ribosomal protein L4 [Chloroflexi bacterium]|nr:50S ribosomal protein L4 [Chloroflexota bacterium]MDK1044435.1 50S ribosomal protein L4 [Anaerolineales bacterium]MCI0772059.1 50S ribosomal protein L4 [Chloroflexota bacterium]MCI0805804.1 50S ribosomal protein L4 [Chloroflexota bacterium]MCI0826342.1 50S ribosomal protein L4 [Chloroflexota bacterium]
MKAEVFNIKGEKVNTAELPKAIFEAEIKPDLMHQAYLRQLANARLGTHKTKTRSEVAGGGRKPWRQKGTGRARHGSIRSPIWVGGGAAHKPQPRDYSQRMPRKMRRAALRSALSVKAGDKQITVLDELNMAEPNTREMTEILKALAGDESALILLPAKSENVEKSVRNIPKAKVLHASYVNVRDLLHYDRLIMPIGSIEVLQKYLDPNKSA